MVRLKFLFSVVVAGLILNTLPAEAQNSNAVLTARVEVLERQVRALRARLGMNPPASVAEEQPVSGSVSAGNPALVADLTAKMGTLEAQLRKLTGRLEEYEYHQRQLKEELDILRKDMELQRRDTETASQNVSGPAESAKPGAATKDGGETLAPVEEAKPEAPSVELPAGSPAEQYDYAFAFVRKNDLASGRIAMEKFLAANPNDERVGYAKFWLGRMNVLEGRNAQAAQYLLSVIEDHPNHERRPDALVELADVLIKLGAAGDACNALLEFRRVEDKASPRLKSRVERLVSAARCG